MTTDHLEPETSRRITRRYAMTIEASAADAFVYMCPRREHEYLPDWKAEIVYSESGYAEAGCIFQTRRDEDPEATTWVIHTHDPRNLEVHFVMVTPGSRVGRLSVVCAPIEGEANRCRATFTYEITPIAEHGDRFLNDVFTAENFEAMMQGEEKALNHFLAKGHMLKG
jgi:hypothetical protein